MCARGIVSPGCDLSNPAITLRALRGSDLAEPPKLGPRDPRSFGGSMAHRRHGFRVVDMDLGANTSSGMVPRRTCDRFQRRCTPSSSTAQPAGGCDPAGVPGSGCGSATCLRALDHLHGVQHQSVKRARPARPGPADRRWRSAPSRWVFQVASVSTAPGRSTCLNKWLMVSSLPSLSVRLGHDLADDRLSCGTASRFVREPFVSPLHMRQMPPRSLVRRALRVFAVPRGCPPVGRSIQAPPAWVAQHEVRRPLMRDHQLLLMH